MKVAYFSPLNPVRSGISDYSEELLPYLAEKFEIEIFIDDYAPNNKSITDKFEIYNYKEFDSRKKRYDACLYHQGNNPYHEYIYNMILQHPGIVVMHDYLLHHLVAHMTLGRGDKDGYIDIMRLSGGQAAVDIAEAWIGGLYGEIQAFQFPCNERVIENSLGVIVHNDYARRSIQRRYPSAKVGKVNLPLGPEPAGVIEGSKDKIREFLKMPKGEFIVASFGFITPPKRLDKSLDAFAKFKALYPSSKYYLVGEENPHYNIREIIRALGMEIDKDVVITGYVDFVDFHNYIKAIDLSINLRYPTAGETSAALIRTLGAGNPTVVSNYRQFSEFPDDCCMKVDFGNDEVDQLFYFMQLICKDKSKAAWFANNARRYVREDFSLDGAADGYYRFIKEVTGKI